MKSPVVFSRVCVAQTILTFICSVLYIIVCSLSLFARTLSGLSGYNMERMIVDQCGNMLGRVPSILHAKDFFCRFRAISIGVVCLFDGV